MKRVAWIERSEIRGRPRSVDFAPGFRCAQSGLPPGEDEKRRRDATKGRRQGLAVSAPDDVHAMAAALVSAPALVSGASAMHAARLLARLPGTALPPRPQMPQPASLLLGPQARHAGRGLGQGRRRLPAVARPPRRRLDQRRGGPVAVLTSCPAKRGRNDVCRLFVTLPPNSGVPEFGKFKATEVGNIPLRLRGRVGAPRSAARRGGVCGGAGPQRALRAVTPTRRTSCGDLPPPGGGGKMERC
jgi:hypothetical protein